jgi:hypothetical protein
LLKDWSSTPALRAGFGQRLRSTARCSFVLLYVLTILAAPRSELWAIPALRGASAAADAPGHSAPSLPPGYLDETGTTFNVTWSLSCQTPPADAVAALEYAASLWGTWISSTVPIEVTACWTSNLNCSGDALACGGPLAYQINFPNAPWVGTFYPSALANALSGNDLDPARADITLQFKADVAWSFAITTTYLTAPSTPTDDEDFVTVALHEIAHGLGYIGNMYEDYNVGFCGDGLYGYLYPCPTTYDRFVVDSGGVALLYYHVVNPITLGARLKSDANFGGPNTVAANGGTAAKLYTPPTFLWGSSLSHLDLSTFQTGENRLMTPSYSDVTRHPGPVTLAIFQDMGWLRADGVPNVVTSGPWVVGAGQAATFTCDLIWSGYAGQPITYTWTATDQVTATHPGLTATDGVTFTWATLGEKRITLTATDGASFGNGDASAAATRMTLVFDVATSGPAQGDTDHAYTFDANVMPEIMSFPITYTWEATDQTLVVHPGQSTADSAAFTWTMPGTKAITITAAIAGATAQSVHTITIEGVVFDQFIFLPLVQRSA